MSQNFDQGNSPIYAYQKIDAPPPPSYLPPVMSIEQQVNAVIEYARHPTEKSRFQLALITVVVTAILLIITAANFLTVVLSFFLIWGVILLFLQIYQIHLRGSAIQVSELNFPEIYRAVGGICQQLNYAHPVEVYITNGGSFNATLHRFMNANFIIITSDLAHDMIIPENHGEMRFILGRFIGELKANSMQLSLFRFLVVAIKGAIITNLLILPYERAKVYSGDRIGFTLNTDIEVVLSAMNKLLIGKDLSQRINYGGLIKQANAFKKSGWADFVQLTFTQPYIINRYLELLAFTRDCYPTLYQHFLETHKELVQNSLYMVLPERK